MVAIRSFAAGILAVAGAATAKGRCPSQTCSTVQGYETLAGPVPTTTVKSTSVVTVTQNLISTVQDTVIPVTTATVVTTESVTETATAEPMTNTATDTSTIFVTTTGTADATIATTVFATATSTTLVVSTVTTYASFIAIQRDPSYVARKRDTVANVYHGGNIPQAVTCVQVHTSTTTVTSSTITNHGSTSTAPAVTRTATSTVLTTVTTTASVAEVSTTITSTVEDTITATTTVTTTTTELQTRTVESQVPTATVYPACQPENILGTANGGQNISGFNRFDGVSNRPLGAGYTPQSCCEACAAEPICRGSFFTIRTNSCALLVAYDTAVCGNADTGFLQDAFSGYFTRSGTPYVILSNGPCGRYTNAGPAPV
ncbi:hypothetical protein Micbo1qcDRAFT_222139 [Microdochium bolleyi]|uniref:Apple domain-containing protein n=1 Tax=Microdochium bolleyi TaxID=196109 RepID=A0A136ILH8_9PEZI|nr:hypothetical protein Micbo1qcDRAFT_222139 [Microdochium bolleyi]